MLLRKILSLAISGLASFPLTAAPSVEELAKIIAVQQALIESLKPADGTILAFNRADCPSGWVPADGTNGTPDLRGVFLRGTNNFGTSAGRRSDQYADPEDRTRGSTQAFATSAAGLTNAASAVSGRASGTTDGNNRGHTHGWNANNIKLQGIPRFTGTGTISSFGLEGGPAEATAAESQNHTHTFNVGITEGNAAAQVISSTGRETRPSNVAVLYCIYKSK